MAGLLGIATNTSWTQAADLLAGVARTDVTPHQPVMLAGYQSRKELSRGVHDPLSARAVAFEQDGHRLLLVSLDNLGFYQNTAAPLRETILEATGLRPSELLLCAVHTHSAPTLTLNAGRDHPNNIAYTRTLQTNLTDLVRQALANLGPTELRVASGASPVGVNRRQIVEDASGNRRIVLGRNPDLPTDREVQVLKLVHSEDAKLVAVLFAYATHSTSLGPGNYLVSGDIHGLAEQFLERYLRSGVTAPGFAGASGDIDPWVRILPGFRSENGWIPEPVLMGTLLGEEVARVLEGMNGSSFDGGPIRTMLKTLELPAKPVAAADATTAPTVPFTLTVGCIGDIAFVGFGGEVFNETGRAVKNASPFTSTFIFTHCNAADGYVPTRSSYTEGGYEVQTSPFGPGAEDQLITATLQTLRELKSTAGG